MSAPEYCKCRLSRKLKKINYKGVRYCGLCYLDQDEIARDFVDRMCKDPRLCSAAKMAIGNEMKRRGAEEGRKFVQSKKKEVESYESEESDHYSEGESGKFEREDRPAQDPEPEMTSTETKSREDKQFPPLSKNSGRGGYRGRGRGRGQ